MSTIPIEARISIQTLAMFAKYFAEKGVIITTRSNLISSALDMFAQILVQNNMAEIPETIEESIQLLQLFNLNPVTKRTRDILIKQLAEEAVSKESLMIEPPLASNVAQTILQDLKQVKNEAKKDE